MSKSTNKVVISIVTFVFILGRFIGLWINTHTQQRNVVHTQIRSTRDDVAIDDHTSDRYGNRDVSSACSNCRHIFIYFLFSVKNSLGCGIHALCQLYIIL